MTRPITVPRPNDTHTYDIYTGAYQWLRSGTSNSIIDLNGLASDEFFVTMQAGGDRVSSWTRYLSGTATRLLTVSDQADGRTLLEFDRPGGTPIYVRVTRPGGGTVFEGWRYESQMSLTLAAGRYDVEFAAPSAPFIRSSFVMAGSGRLATPSRSLDVPGENIPHGFAIFGAAGESIIAGSNDSRIDISRFSEGSFRLELDRGGVKSSSGFVLDTRLPTGLLTLNSTPDGRVEFDVAGLGARSAMYVGIVDYRGAAVFRDWVGQSRWSADLAPGGYRMRISYADGAPSFETAFSVGVNDQVSADVRSSVALAMPRNWAGYALRDPQGTIVKAGAVSNWVDMTDVKPGRYSLSDAADSSKRLNIVVDAAAPGGVVVVTQRADGSVLLDWDDPQGRSFYHVAPINGQTNAPGYYVYGSEVVVPAGDGTVGFYISGSGLPGFSISLQRVRGTLEAVNYVGLRDGADWAANQFKLLDALSPITADSGLIDFTFLPQANARYAVQTRDLQTGTVSTWFSDTPHVQGAFDPGRFEWRAYSLPINQSDAPGLRDALAKLPGPWQQVTQYARPPERDYVLGVEPDQVRSTSDLRLNYPTDSIRLSDGSVVISNTYAANIVRVYPDGRVENLVGNGREGYSAPGAGRDVMLRGPAQVFQASEDEIYFSDQRNFVIRSYNLRTGLVSDVLGVPGSGDLQIVNGKVASAGIVYDIGRDAAGRLFFTSQPGYTYGDQVIATGPTQIIRQQSDGSWKIWPVDTRYIAAGNYSFANMLWHDGVVSAIVFDGTTRKYMKFADDGTALGVVDLKIQYAAGIVKDPVSGNLLIGGHTALMQLNHNTLQLSTYPTSEPFANISGLSVSGNSLLLTDSDRGIVFNKNLSTGSSTTVAGARLNVSNVYVDLYVDGDRLYALDNQTPRIMEVGPNGVRVVAGNGEQALAGNSGDFAKSYRFPNALTSDGAGGFLVAENNHRIIRVDKSGNASVFAGTLASGYTGDGGRAAAARFESIYGLDRASDGTVYVADTFNDAIRKISPDGIVTTIAGNGTAGMNGSSVLGSVLNAPMRVLAAPGGSVLVADSWNNRVVEITADGRLFRVAGMGQQENYQGKGSFGGDGGLAIHAQLNTPMGLARHADGTLFIADQFNNRVRYVDIGGKIHTLVGAERGYGAGQLLNLPADVAVMGNDVLVADTGNALVLRITSADRTGNDLRSALDVDAAITKYGSLSRLEHVDGSDVDAYIFNRGTNNGVVIRADAPLTARLWNWETSTPTDLAVLPGQTVTLFGKDVQAFELRSPNTVPYRIDLVAYPPSSGRTAAALVGEELVFDALAANAQPADDLAWAARAPELPGGSLQMPTAIDYFAV